MSDDEPEGMIWEPWDFHDGYDIVWYNAVCPHCEKTLEVDGENTDFGEIGGVVPCYNCDEPITITETPDV